MANNKNSNKKPESHAVRTANKKNHPSHAIPKGLIGVEIDSEKNFDEQDDFVDGFNQADFNIIDLGVIEPPIHELMTPDGIMVISQTARITKDGRTVVDVVLDVGPPAGATGYDIRIARQQGADNI